MDIWTAKQIIDGAAADLEKFGPTHGSAISSLVADRLKRLSQELDGTGHLTAAIGLRYDDRATSNGSRRGLERDQNGE